MQAFPPLAQADLDAIVHYRVTNAGSAITRQTFNLVPGDVVARVPDPTGVTVITLRSGAQLAPGISQAADTLLATLVASGDIVELADAP